MITCPWLVVYTWHTCTFCGRSCTMAHGYITVECLVQWPVCSTVLWQVFYTHKCPISVAALTHMAHKCHISVVALTHMAHMCHISAAATWHTADILILIFWFHSQLGSVCMSVSWMGTCACVALYLKLGRNGIITIIIKRISRAPIYHTRWQHRVLYNNTNHIHTHMHARMHAHTHPCSSLYYLQN